MAPPFGPGNYFIRLKDDVPSLFTDQGVLIDITIPPTFEIVGDGVFTFTVEDKSPQGDPLTFADPFITWRNTQNVFIQQPPNDQVQLNEDTTILTLNVSSPSGEQNLQFVLHLNGSTIDPTIVEKPPEGGSS